MHFATLFLLPLLVAADQVPLKDKAAGWFDKAKAYIPSAVPVPHPIDAGAAKVADQTVERLTIRNWERKLSPKLDTEEEWMVYVTGGNKSCFGRCGPVDLTWNESVPLLAAMQKRSGSPKLRIGQIDCEKESVLCTGWAATMPSVYHFSVPKKSDPQEKVPLHVVPLNMTLTTVDDIVSIPTASKSRYLQYEEYTGMLHPFDGWVAQFGLLKPFGYFMWGVGNVPSWAMMLIISFVSRNIMSRRMTGGRAGAPSGAPGAAPEAQTPSRPAPAAAPKSGGGKKRK